MVAFQKCSPAYYITSYLLVSFEQLTFQEATWDSGQKNETLSSSIT